MQRYDHYIREFGETGYNYTSDMQRIENGEWVRYEEASKMLADRDAEIERLRADLVWAVTHNACIALPEEGLEYWQDPDNPYTVMAVECDGTPESICRAVREERTNGVR